MDPRFQGPWALHDQLAVKVMDRVLPEGSVIGSWDSGVIGYFLPFPVVNLDGLANSWDYFHFLESLPEFGRGKNLLAIKQRFGITHFANIGASPIGEAHTLLYQGPPLAYGPHKFAHQLRKARRFSLWTTHQPGSLKPREDDIGGINRSDWFWERMEPHFERQTGGGVGLLVDGRLAQAFVRGCAPDELAIWTWTVREDGIGVASWAHTETGLCVSVGVLPHDASDVRVARVTKDEFLADFAGRLPAIHSGFDVYLLGNYLVYVKEPCTQDDVAARFFVHVEPMSPGDLPPYRRPHGFDRFVFKLGRQDEGSEGVCFASYPLPSWDIAGIRTGQFLEAEGGYRNIWTGEIRPG